MKNIKYINKQVTLVLGMLTVFFLGCDREISDDVAFAEFGNTAEIFTDSPIGMGTDFYFPFIGSKPDAWSVDEQVSYKGTSSMRFDIPNVGDPGGSYAGAIFRIDGEGSGRNLTGFDALTFWAKASEARTINDVGFGQDFLENKFQTELKGALSLTTNWKKYIIPIPDPSVLVAERGMFWYAEGPNDDGTGYTFWIDELKFEKLGTVAQPLPAILDGQDVAEQVFSGSTINLAERGLTQTYNTASGENITVNAAGSYFKFTSTDNDVARVSETGILTVVGSGTATITASLGDVKAIGSLTIESSGSFDEAPTPTRAPSDVISIFSDAYTNVPVDYYNGFFNGDGQTTLGGAPPITLGSGLVINYTNLNFVGIGTFLDVQPINASEMTHLHVDINVQEDLQTSDFLRLLLLNSVGNGETSGATTLNSSQLKSGEWVSFDIPLSDFSGLVTKNQIGLLFFVSDSTISNIFVDNIYFYKE